MFLGARNVWGGHMCVLTYIHVCIHVFVLVCLWMSVHLCLQTKELSSIMLHLSSENCLSLNMGLIDSAKLPGQQALRFYHLCLPSARYTNICYIQVFYVCSRTTWCWLTLALCL